MNQLIDNWIKTGKNYESGRILYSVLGKNEQLKASLAKAKTATLAKELEKALLQIHAGKAEQVASKPKPSAKVPVPSVHVPPKQSDKPVNDTVLQAIDAEWKPIYKEMQLFRHKLRQYGNSNAAEHVNERAAWAQKVLDLEQQCLVIWRKRDYYIANGKLPDVQVDKQLPTDPLEIGRRVENLKRYIRREGEKLKKNPANAGAAMRRKEYLDEYQQLTGKQYQESDKNKR